MESIDFLSRFVIDCDDQVPPVPFLAQSGKTVWSVATDGNMLVGVREGLDLLTFNKALVRKILNYLTTPLKPGFSVAVETLLRWSGPAPTEIPNDEPADSEVGVLAGKLIDLRRLSLLLEAIEVESVYVWDASVTGVWSVGIEWDNGRGRAIIGGINQEPRETDNHFSVPKSEVDQLLELAMQDED